jgi:hypothetical protein
MPWVPVAVPANKAFGSWGWPVFKQGQELVGLYLRYHIRLTGCTETILLSTIRLMTGVSSHEASRPQFFPSLTKNAAKLQSYYTWAFLYILQSKGCLASILYKCINCTEFTPSAALLLYAILRERTKRKFWPQHETRGVFKLCLLRWQLPPSLIADVTYTGAISSVQFWPTK